MGHCGDSECFFRLYSQAPGWRQGGVGAGSVLGVLMPGVSLPHPIPGASGALQDPRAMPVAEPQTWTRSILSLKKIVMIIISI